MEGARASRYHHVQAPLKLLDVCCCCCVESCRKSSSAAQCNLNVKDWQIAPSLTETVPLLNCMSCRTPQQTPSNHPLHYITPLKQYSFLLCCFLPGYFEAPYINFCDFLRSRTWLSTRGEAFRGESTPDGGFIMKQHFINRMQHFISRWRGWTAVLKSPSARSTRSGKVIFPTAIQSKRPL